VPVAAQGWRLLLGDQHSQHPMAGTVFAVLPPLPPPAPGHGSGWTPASPGRRAGAGGHEGLMLPQPPAERAGKETTRCSETNFTA